MNKPKFKIPQKKEPSGNEVEKFASKAAEKDETIYPWEGREINAKTFSHTFPLLLNEKQKLMLQYVAEKEDISMQKVVRRGLEKELSLSIKRLEKQKNDE